MASEVPNNYMASSNGDHFPTAQKMPLRNNTTISTNPSESGTNLTSMSTMRKESDQTFATQPCQPAQQPLSSPYPPQTQVTQSPPQTNNATLTLQGGVPQPRLSFTALPRGSCGFGTQQRASRLLSSATSTAPRVSISGLKKSSIVLPGFSQRLSASFAGQRNSLTFAGSQNAPGVTPAPLLRVRTSLAGPNVLTPFAAPPQNARVSFAGSPQSAPAYLAPPYTTPTSFSGPPQNTPTSFAGPPQNTPTSFAGPPQNTPTSFAGPPQNKPTSFAGLVQNASTSFAGPPYNTPTSFAGPPYITPTSFAGSPQNAPTSFAGPPYNTATSFAGTPQNATTSSTGPLQPTPIYPAPLGAPLSPARNSPAGANAAAPGPPMHQTGPPLHQTGPPLYQTGPPLHQTGPPPYQAGPPLYQAGPPLYQAGPPLYQAGPPLYQAGPPPYQAGPPLYQAGPPLHPTGLHSAEVGWAASAGANFSSNISAVPPSLAPTSQYATASNPFQVPPPSLREGRDERQRNRLSSVKLPSDWGKEKVRRSEKSQYMSGAPSPTTSRRSSGRTDFQSEFNHWEDFVRPTMFRLPVSQSLASLMNMPVGYILQPLAPLLEGQPEVPLVPTMSGGIMRCQQCRAYVNPYSRFEPDGKKWQCNLCGFSTETPTECICPADEFGSRLDRDSRPELMTTTVEYMAPTEYGARDPQKAIYLFVIDVSVASVESEFLRTATEAISKTFQEIHATHPIEVGLITYNSTVHFYKLTKKNPEMIVMPNVEDPFMPISDGVVTLADHAETIISFVDSLAHTWKDTTNTDTCMATAIKAAQDVLKESGGVICLFPAQMSLLGPGPLIQNPRRHSPAKLNTADESELLRPENDGFSRLGEELALESICVSIFLGTKQNYDLATVVPMVTVTGGEVYHYPSFTPQIYAKQLHGDVHHLIARTHAWESAIRVRLSKGWKVAQFYGHLYKRDEIVIIPNCNEFQTFAVTIELAQKVAPEPLAYLQYAVLYTADDQSRRVRVHTWCCPTGNSVYDLALSTDSEASCNLIARIAMEIAIQETIDKARQYVEDSLKRVLCMQASAPSSFPLMPVDLFGILKCKALSRGIIPADDRIAIISRLRTASLPLAAAYFYPRLICLTEKPVDSDSGRRRSLPFMLNLSADIVMTDGIYVVENGVKMYIFVGEAVDPEILTGLFGVETQPEVENPGVFQDFVSTVFSDEIDQHPNEFVRHLGRLLPLLCDERLPTTLQIELALHNSSCQDEFFEYLIEDQSKHIPHSYKDYVSKMALDDLNGMAQKIANADAAVSAMMPSRAQSPVAAYSPQQKFF